ncbi:MAG: alpha/beta hydrolase [Maricaulaceae bacterium]|jgi:pimeloyl-ACP methyl ester carboxylesterase
MKISKAHARLIGAAACMLAAGCATTGEQVRTTVLGTTCNAPPRLDCPEANCDLQQKVGMGDALEPVSGRTFYLDFPCDLRAGEEVNFILNLHGGGSVGAWQRHYFPALDLTEDYRLVVATPTAWVDDPSRRWTAEEDDEYLHRVVDLVMDAFGQENIATFWIAGHSQGGLTGRRIVCTDYFASKVDGFISLSGGRLGSQQVGERPPAEVPDCDFSFIYAAGALEAQAEAATDYSEVAERYNCGARVRQPDVVDTRAGYVTATDQSRGPSWGRFARPGTAEVYAFEGCDDGRVVADVIRLDKGHTEGYEPEIMDVIVEMMVNAPGGNARDG